MINIRDGLALLGIGIIGLGLWLAWPPLAYIWYGLCFLLLAGVLSYLLQPDEEEPPDGNG